MGYKYNPFTGEFDRVEETTLPPEVPTQFDTDSGTAIPAADVINFFGDASQGIHSSGSGNTVTYTVDDASDSQKGVVELATNAETITGSSSTLSVVPAGLNAKLGTQTANSVPYGQGNTSSIGWTSALTNGQIVIGSSGGAPAAANITSTGGTIAISNGANTINLEVDGEVSSSFPTDSGTAIPSSGALTIHGGVLLSTSGSGSTVTVDANGTVVGSIATDSGTCTPSGNSFTLAGAGSASTSASGSTVTITVAGGGIMWSVQTGASATLVASDGIFANRGGGVSLALPTTAAVGDTFQVVAMNAGGFTITQQTGQQIQIGNTTTTITTGTLTSTTIGDWIEIICNVADTNFMCNVKQGNITIT